MFLEYLGYDSATSRWREGLICDTSYNIAVQVSELIRQKGYNGAKGVEIILNALHSDEINDMQDVCAVDSPHAVFRTLKHYSKKIAVCTTDSRDSSERMLAKYNLAPFVDVMLCGDDQKAFPKPDPRNIEYISERLNVRREFTAFVGDSQRDMEMARTAEVGLSVGVTSGVCTAVELSEAYADVIIPSIEQLFNVVSLGRGHMYKHIYNWYKRKPVI